MKVGRQIAENARIHGASKEEAKRRALEVMGQVGLPDVERLYNEYPHRLSGGMRQRVMIAMALVNQPELLIADEPTTALDVTIQAQIMELIRQMNRGDGHRRSADLPRPGVIRQMCTRVYIMYAGRVVESGETKEVLAHPLHPYTKGLIASIPSLEKRGQRLSSIPRHRAGIEDRSEHGCPFTTAAPSAGRSRKGNAPPWWCTKATWRCAWTQRRNWDCERDREKAPLLEIRALTKEFRQGQGPCHGRAQDRPGHSKRGGLWPGGGIRAAKSTFGQMLVHLLDLPPAPSGWRGGHHPARRERKDLCKRMQIVFQDPYSSIDPNKTIGWLIEEPLKIHGIGKTKQEAGREGQPGVKGRVG